MNSASSIGKAIKESVWIRTAIVLAIAVAVVAALLPSDMREMILLKGAYYFGAYLAPGIVVGAVIGWLKFSKRVWLWSTLISIVVLDGLVLFVNAQ
jgi:hypothetical protein